MKTINKQKTNKTNNGTTTSILFEGFKLETPHPTNTNVEPQKPQDDWQRQVAYISIQLKQLTTEPDSPSITQQAAEQHIPQESLYELLGNAPDIYFTNPHEPHHPNIDVTPKMHHNTITNTCEKTNSSCNEPKQPLLDNDIANHIQFDKERNLSYFPISTSLTLKRKRQMYYMPMDFEKLTLDGLIDTGALTSAISEQDLNKLKLLANESIKKQAHRQIFKLWWPMTTGSSNRHSTLGI